MKSMFLSESRKETQVHDFNPQSWLQVERGKLMKLSSYSPSSIESLIKLLEPPILPYFKPVDYVSVLAQIHEELEQCKPEEKSDRYLLQYHVFRGLGETKLLRRSLHSAWKHSTTVYEKIIYGTWLRYEKQGEEFITDLLSSCGKCCRELEPVDVVSEIPAGASVPVCETSTSSNVQEEATMVSFQIGEEMVICERHKISSLSIPFHTMLNGPFTETNLEVIDLSENGISAAGMRCIANFSVTGVLAGNGLSADFLLEILVFANKFCCEKLKEACDRKLTSLVCSRQDAIELITCALEENAPVLVATCMQVLLRELPNCLADEQVLKFFSNVNKEQQYAMVGRAAFPFYSLLSEVSMKTDPTSEKTVRFVERMVESAVGASQKQIAYHQLGCVRFLRKEYGEAVRAFNAALSSGHVYSIAGIARVACLRGNTVLAFEKLTSVISSYQPLGWMFLERSLYTNANRKLEDLDMATELDPTLTYPYMYRAINLLKKQVPKAALDEVNRILGFKMALECLELRFCIHLVMENYDLALRDVHAILTLAPGYRMVEGRVEASKIATLLSAQVDKWSSADCWMHLYERWSAVDDVGSLSVIFQMMETDAPKGVLYFRQSLLLLRLNCPEAAMRSLQLARQHACSEHERLIYEGWLLYDTGHCQEALLKAEESIGKQRSFEAFFLKAYVLADSGMDPSCSVTCISLLEEALKCPSDRLRKGQALNNLGGVYLDCEKLDLAADCYTSALKIRHTRAHQGLARVHFLKNKRVAAFEEMTQLIETAKSNASAYEKRSEYCDREQTMKDLEMVTRLDPLRVYPYRYRAAVLMDSRKEKEAIAELTHAIAFKADLYLLHLRAAFHEHIGDLQSALQDCRAALSLDPNHQEMLELHKRVHNQETITGFDTM
ncbi:ETO1-like protein 1 [Rhynchospora pubera]|uniref:ETO1-like protein 1 n=1 Tax=Rhynchospora pubera TaxID=906938 RepID=A0AAV8CWL9_9POAL|nr:ETO1-like protein 1 [Rhynchospora pubera]